MGTGLSGLSTGPASRAGPSVGRGRRLGEAVLWGEAVVLGEAVPVGRGREAVPRRPVPPRCHNLQRDRALSMHVPSQPREEERAWRPDIYDNACPRQVLYIN